MKKILFTLLLALTVSGVYAQDIFNEIKSNAQKTVADPTANQMVKQISQFKLDALDYLIIKMREQMPDSTAIFLDKQAYAMNNFITYYIQNILDNQTKPKAQQLQVMKLFMDASYSNPLFNDPDAELTLSYFSNGECLTRFSLDTDWRRAVVAVMMELRKEEQ